eukprot:415823-Prymnesium_polylepis.2
MAQGGALRLADMQVIEELRHLLEKQENHFIKALDVLQRHQKIEATNLQKKVESIEEKMDQILQGNGPALSPAAGKGKVAESTEGTSPSAEKTVAIDPAAQRAGP